MNHGNGAGEVDRRGGSGSLLGEGWRMERAVLPEWLDELPPTDPEALASRRDLRRINALMGNARIALRAWRAALGERMPRRIVELGAGDGTFLLELARRLGSEARGTEATLIDQQETVSPRTLSEFSKLGWQIRIEKKDVFDWAAETDHGSFDLILANLFLHHLSDEQLVLLLPEVAERTRALVAVEPRRSYGALLYSRLLGVIGCNRVTRHDAPISVRAGFAGFELSRCWPEGGDWALEERLAGRFSHLFVAWRTRK
jgi:SAM-dependent methyltransferase